MEHYGPKYDRVKGYDILACEACGFVHIDPIPTDPELKGLYADEYYTTEKPLFIDRLVEDLGWWNTIYDERYDSFEDLLPPARRRVLDVGCGPGYFLKRGLERGWSCLGVEPSRQACSHARGQGIEVLNLFLDDEGLTTAGRRFDVVHLSEVLEHVSNPARICSMARDLLTPGGILCVVVPNDYNPLQRLLRERLQFEPYWLAPPFHINYFDFHSLERLLQATGFKVVKKTSMFPMELFLLMGDNYVGDDALGRACHSKRKRLDLLLDEPGLQAFKRRFYELCASHGLGREIVVYGCAEEG